MLDFASVLEKQRPACRMEYLNQSQRLSGSGMVFCILKDHYIVDCSVCMCVNAYLCVYVCLCVYNVSTVKCNVLFDKCSSLDIPPGPQTYSRKKTKTFSVMQRMCSSSLQS